MTPSRVDYKPGDRFEGTVERIVPGGLGLIRGPAGVVFVEAAAPGDSLLFEITSVRSGTARGAIVELLEPGPNRVEPACPWYGRCGGCDFQHLSGDFQIVAKRQIVEDALKRIGNIELSEEIEMHPATLPLGSRIRAEFHVDRGTNVVGFFARGSNKVVPIDRCVVASVEVNRGLEAIRQSARPRPASIRVIGAAGEMRADPAFPPLKGGAFWHEIGPMNYLIDPEAFFQSSLELLPALIDRVTDVEGGAPNLAWDLFCGAGLFSLPLSTRYERVEGVDSAQRSIANAIESAERNQIGNAAFFAEDVYAWITRRQRERALPDLIVVDPPRAGLSRKLVEHLARRRSKRLTYVSCDPTTLARDLRILLDGAYRLQDVAIFDLFPQTHHVETVVRLAAQ